MNPFLGLARLMASGEGQRLLATIQRQFQSQGVPLDQLLHDFVDYLERLETVAKKSGKTVKQVAEESLNLYESGSGRKGV